MRDLRALIARTRLAQIENEHVRKFTQNEANDACGVYGWEDKYRVIQKTGNFWKTQQKLKKSKKKNLLTEIEPLQLAF